MIKARMDSVISGSNENQNHESKKRHGRFFQSYLQHKRNLRSEVEVLKLMISEQFGFKVSLAAAVFQ